MNAAEIVQLAIRDSRNENRTVHLASDLTSDPAQAEALYEELLAEADGSSYGVFWGDSWQIFWGEGWQIYLHYA